MKKSKIGLNTSAAVKRAEAVACPTCDVGPGESCFAGRFRYMTPAAKARGLGRASKPHAARLRAAGLL